MVQGDANSVRGLEGLDIQALALLRITRLNVDFARVPVCVQVAMEMVDLL